MYSFIDEIPIIADEYITLIPGWFVQLINGHIISNNIYKYRVILKGCIEFYNLSFDKIYKLTLRTPVTSIDNISDDRHELIAKTINNYLYKLVINCKLLSMDYDPQKTTYIFQEL